MKTTPVILLLLLLSPALAAAAVLGELRLSLIEGDVQIRTADHAEWAPAVINLPLKDGDQLWVPAEARAEVESRRGTIVRLDESSALDILTVDSEALQLYLSLGLAYVNAKGDPDTTLQIDTPLSSLRVYERAKFSAEVSGEGETDIKVFLGAISAEDRKGETKVTAGKQLSLAKGAANLSPLSASIDPWERWNGDRDQVIEERRASVRYLPAELASYSSDFDNNGEWVEVPTYGSVWRPSVQGRDWSPYRHGRWVWIGDDYVWIAQESWGWAPYHYGRWSFVGRHGWCWVPPSRHEVYWGPGYVGWVQTPTYVSWVPLAPREVYYGHGYYGPHSVDIVRINVNKVVIKNVYKNVAVKDSVTTVHNDTFIRGRHRDFKPEENPFRRGNIRAGRPQLAPEEATRVASNREIPRSKEPPIMVQGNKVKEVKAHRRLVPQADKSVFLPEAAPKPMVVEEKAEPRPRGQRRGQGGRGETPPAVGERQPPDEASGQGHRETTPEAPPAPDAGVWRDGRRQQPEARDSQGRQNRDEARGQASPAASPPPAPAKDAAPPAPAAPPPGAKDEAAPPVAPPPPPPPAPAAEVWRDGKRQQPEARDSQGQQNRDEARGPSAPAAPPPPEVPPPTPAAKVEPPQQPTVPAPESRPERQGRPRSEGRGRPQSRDEAGSEAPPQVTPPAPPPEVAPPTPPARVEPPQQPMVPAPESRPERQEGRPSEGRGRQQNRDEVRSQAPPPEVAPPPPAARVEPPPQPMVPAPESRPARQERPPSEGRGRQQGRDEAGSQPPPPVAPSPEAARPTPKPSKDDEQDDPRKRTKWGQPSDPEGQPPEN